MFSRFRKGYFFGYGADSDLELIKAITGHKPKVVGTALLQGYELRIQSLDEITQAGANPQRILRNAWGPLFRSYVIVRSPGATVRGTLYRISLRDRHKVDAWELVNEGWYSKGFVTVADVVTQKTYTAETQVLSPGQVASVEVDGFNYDPWLIPKEQLLAMAVAVR